MDNISDYATICPISPASTPSQASFKKFSHSSSFGWKQKMIDIAIVVFKHHINYILMKHVIDLMYRICYLEKKSDPVGVVIHGKVCEPGSSIGINNNLITAFQGDENVCSSHRVFMVILIRISSSVIKKRSEQTSV